jgi:thymidine kinase
VAEYITKVHNLCSLWQSGNAFLSLVRQFRSNSIGAKDLYEPRCRVCYLDNNLIDFNNPDNNEIK